MIPYFQINSFAFGPLNIQVWGLLVSAGLLVGIFFAKYLVKKYVYAWTVVLDIVIWATFGGLIGARLFHVVFYEPAFYLAHPAEIYRLWHGGASSLGAFFGAAVTLYIFAKVRDFSWPEILPYLDLVTVSFWLAWGIGRLGCFLIHDHPGRLSNFFLAVNFPAGARHDLGLYESLLAFIIFVIFYFALPHLAKKRWGLTFMLSFMVYAVVRFFLDFLRATDLVGADVRYAYLTPAQWGMLAIFSILTVCLFWGKIRKPKTVGEVA